MSRNSDGKMKKKQKILKKMCFWNRKFPKMKNWWILMKNRWTVELKDRINTPQSLELIRFLLNLLIMIVSINKNITFYLILVLLLIQIQKWFWKINLKIILKHSKANFNHLKINFSNFKIQWLKFQKKVITFQNWTKSGQICKRLKNLSPKMKIFLLIK